MTAAADPIVEAAAEGLGRELTPAEAALFENLWSEHCAYSSSAPLLSAFESEGAAVVVGPGDDAAVVALDDDTYLALGIESHNHPSYVDPYDGAATGVGGIVRDIVSMGAYPIALADVLYFGPFERDHSRYLLEGVVEGIADYGNAIGVPTVSGGVSFHPGYAGNPLVNVACVGLLDADRLVTAAATESGNKLVLVGNATGRDGLGGASFASEDLDEDAETEERSAVQVGDPYTEKLLIEANEALLDEGLIEAARDLGAAGLGGASSEMVAKGGLGAALDLDRVHQREPDMSGLEILLAESQERMCYEVAPGNVDRVREIAERFHLGCSVVGELTDTGRYVCTFDGEVVVDVPATYVVDEAPVYEREFAEPAPPDVDVPDVPLETAFDAVVASPNTADKRWVFRQYDHEVGIRTAVPPGGDASLLAIRETGHGLAIAADGAPGWTDAAPYDGGRAVALEAATNLAVTGATPLAAVDCLNGGNPENPDVFGGFRGTVHGLADMCDALEVPVVGGNVSLYNDSPSGPIPPTPTLAMVGARKGYEAPPTTLAGEGELVLVGGAGRGRLGGSEYLAQFGGSDRFPALPDEPRAVIEALADVTDDALAVHDVSGGGLAVTLAELVTADAGASVRVEDPTELFVEAPGRAVVETDEPDDLEARFDGVAPVRRLGSATADGDLQIEAGDERLRYDAAALAERRRVLDRGLE
ncbi:MAG: phosphoribosylformylglycinamidine synthase subunit PurL [Halobacteriales archaeon]|nr:phosphoribosylformylglycinamidine synthase subunit PurL [Halobacteriales archaeon]